MLQTAWGQGIVVSTDPLRVSTSVDELSKPLRRRAGFRWDQVRKLEPTNRQSQIERRLRVGLGADDDETTCGPGAPSWASDAAVKQAEAAETAAQARRRGDC